jgi:phage terminase large subunit
MKYTREWIGVDYGTTNATVFVLVRLGEDDKLYIVDEYRWGEKSDGLPKTDVTLADDLEKFITRNDANPEWIFVDPSAKSFITEIFSRAQHFAPFYKVTGAKNDVLNGIQQLSSLLGVNKLLVAKGLGDLNKEFHSYSWDKKAEAKGEDKPLKKYDHGLDALRYVINGIPRVVEYILKEGA